MPIFRTDAAVPGLWRGTNWKRASLCVLAGAYIGGVIASYTVLAMDMSSFESPALRIYPFYFSLGILPVTIVGTLLVAVIFDQITCQGASKPISYAIAIVSGTILGGMLLGAFDQSISALSFGAIYGFATAACWSAYYKLAFLRSSNPG